MVRIIVADKKHNCEHLVGKAADESMYDYLVALEGNITDDEVDVYMSAVCDLSLQANCISECNTCDNGKDERRIAFKFRRNFFSQEEHDNAYEGLKDAAGITSNRGIAAGNVSEYLDNTDENDVEAAVKRMVTPKQQAVLHFFSNLPTQSTLLESDAFDLEKELNEVLSKEHRHTNDRFSAWVLGALPKDFNFDVWIQEIKCLPLEEIKQRTIEFKDKCISKTMYALTVNSGVAGWYDRYPRFPYGRETSFTRNHPDKFAKSYPFLQSLNKGFKSLLPWRWNNQKTAADKLDPKFLVPDTVFTTLTVNKNFRTYLHFDAGDLQEGLSNLLVLSKNPDYSGAYLVFPEYRIAVSVRPRDLLLVNNHEVLHGNVPIVKHSEEAERVSIIAYFRENMLQLGEYDYEQYRNVFISSRQENELHPLWNKKWNGISIGMWGDSISKTGDYSEAKEWYDFLKLHERGDIWIDKYHPWLRDYFEGNSLEGFL